MQLYKYTGEYNRVARRVIYLPTLRFGRIPPLPNQSGLGRVADATAFNRFRLVDPLNSRRGNRKEEQQQPVTDTSRLRAGGFFHDYMGRLAKVGRNRGPYQKKSTKTPQVFLLELSMRC